MLQSTTNELHMPAKLCGFKRQLSTSASGVHACPEPGCDRQFNRKYTLVEHSKTHTGEKPHVCPVPSCAKRFSTSGNLSRHKRLHGYIEPLRCPAPGCICTFPSNSKLEKHMKFHYGTASKICPLLGCGKTFSTTGNLNRHLKRQHDQKELKQQQQQQQQVSRTPQPVEPVFNSAPLVSFASKFATSSPTNVEQWLPSAMPAVSTSWNDDLPSWPSSSAMGLFEDVWNPVLVDTLVNIFDEQPASFSC